MANPIVPSSTVGKILAGNPKNDGTATAVNTGTNLTLVYNSSTNDYTLNAAGSGGGSTVAIVTTDPTDATTGTVGTMQFNSTLQSLWLKKLADGGTNIWQQITPVVVLGTADPIDSTNYELGTIIFNTSNRKTWLRVSNANLGGNWDVLSVQCFVQSGVPSGQSTQGTLVFDSAGLGLYIQSGTLQTPSWNKLNLTSITSPNSTVTINNGSTYSVGQALTLDIANQGATQNQLLAYNNTKFAPAGLNSLVLAGTNVTITNNANGTITINSSGGGGGAVASFTANPSSGALPLSVTLTDTSSPTPDSIVWTITGTAGIDYIITSGTLTSSSLTVNFLTLNSYTVTMTPTKASTTYTPVTASQTINTTTINGNFNIATTIATVKNRPWINYLSTDVISAQFTLSNAQRCTAIISSVITASNASTVPTITVTTLNINNSQSVNSSAIGIQPTFPVIFTTTVQATMNNSNGTSSNVTQSDTVNYTRPAMVKYTTTNTQPTFAITDSNVGVLEFANGQSFNLADVSTNIYLWVAIPTALYNNSNTLYTSALGTWITSTPDVTGTAQTLLGVSLNIYGYNMIGGVRGTQIYIGGHP